MTLTAPADRTNPLSIASDLRNTFQTMHPFRLSRVNVRVGNDAILLTGSVASYYAKSLAFQLAKAAFGESRIVDSLEVASRRTFATATIA